MDMKLELVPIPVTDIDRAPSGVDCGLTGLEADPIG